MGVQADRGRAAPDQNGLGVLGRSVRGREAQAHVQSLDGGPGSDTARSCGLLVREVVRNAPDEGGLSLDLLGKAALALPLSSVDEAGDAVALLDVRDALSDLGDRPGVVAAEPRVGRREEIAVLPVGRVQRNSLGLDDDLALRGFEVGDVAELGVALGRNDDSLHGDALRYCWSAQ